MTDSSFKKKIQNTHKHCVRNSNEREKCQLCVDICPTEAITPLEKTVTVDSLLCIGCNLCVSQCYSRNFSSEKNPYTTCLNQIVSEEKSDIICKESKSKNTMKDSVDFGCIQAMDPRFVSVFLLSGVDHIINLDLSNCDQCDLNGYIELYIKDLISDIEQYELRSHIHTKDIFEEEEILSRRDVLNRWRLSAKSIADETTDTTTELIDSFLLDENKTEDIDSAIRILLEMVRENNPEKLYLIKGYIFQLLVSENCTLCNQCVYKCPTNALNIETDGEIKTLILDLDRCNFCKRCIGTCPEEAISKDILVDRGKINLLKREPYICKSCRGKAESVDQDGNCISCRIRKKNRNRFELV